MSESSPTSTPIVLPLEVYPRCLLEAGAQDFLDVCSVTLSELPNQLIAVTIYPKGGETGEVAADFLNYVLDLSARLAAV